VEGFFLLCSTNLNGTVFKSGGSALGLEYMALLRVAPTGDPWKTFRVWASGLSVDEALNSINRPQKSNKRIKVTPQAKREPWDLGDYDKNNSAMLDQLRKLLGKFSTSFYFVYWVVLLIWVLI
jgi:hypothetical protein